MRGVTQAAPGHEEANPPPPYPASADPHLPPGWEARTDEVSKKTFYIDHNTKVPAWGPSPPGPPCERSRADAYGSQQVDMGQHPCWKRSVVWGTRCLAGPYFTDQACLSATSACKHTHYQLRQIEAAMAGASSQAPWHADMLDTPSVSRPPHGPGPRPWQGPCQTPQSPCCPRTPPQRQRRPSRPAGACLGTAWRRSGPCCPETWWLPRPRCSWSAGT